MFSLTDARRVDCILFLATRFRKSFLGPKCQKLGLYPNAASIRIHQLEPLWRRISLSI